MNPDRPPRAPTAGVRDLARDTRTMAIGTIASRVTGFMRLATLVAVLGVGGVRQAFEVSNTLPNSLYDLLLGGVLASTLVPALVQAAAKDPGDGYVQRLLTFVVLALTGITALAMATAPQLVRLYSTTDDPAQLRLTVVWAWYFLPQILFYGLSATVGAVLNSRGRFAAPVWAPVVNNLVAIATLAVFVVTPGPPAATPAGISTAQQVVLGVGTTLGVVAMAVALLPPLRASGFRWQLRLDLRGMGLRHLGRLAAWTFLYVVATQLAYLVLTRLATDVGQLPQYATAFLVWQLPYAVVAVSVLTALLPRMSRRAVERRLDLMREELTQGMRLSALLIIPAALALLVLGEPVAVALFAHGQTTYSEAAQIGKVLAVFSLGLVPFSIYQVQSRVFYALGDTKTPALVQVAVSSAMVLVDLAASAALPEHLRVYGLAAGLVVANCVGAAVTTGLVRRRLPSAPGAGGAAGHTHRSLGGALSRMAVAGFTAAAVATVVSAALAEALPPDWIGAALRVLAAAVAAIVVYVTALLLLRVDEVRAVLSPNGFRRREPPSDNLT